MNQGFTQLGSRGQSGVKTGLTPIARKAGVKGSHAYIDMRDPVTPTCYRATPTEIWTRESLHIPVIVRKLSGPILIRLPWRDDNREWLQNDGRIRPLWRKLEKCWECPRAWFERITQQAAERFSGAWVIQEIRELEKCAPACRHARGIECTCSCGGANHGRDGDGWFDVSETFSFRRGPSTYSCRKITGRGQPCE